MGWRRYFAGELEFCEQRIFFARDGSHIPATCIQSLFGEGRNRARPAERGGKKLELKKEDFSRKGAIFLRERRSLTT